MKYFEVDQETDNFNVRESLLGDQRQEYTCAFCLKLFNVAYAHMGQGCCLSGCRS